jgi:hypothetical protein
VGKLIEPADAVNEGLDLRKGQVQILCRALAHVVHDVQNHLAIISESAGWMKDLLKDNNKGRFNMIFRFLKRNRIQRLHEEQIVNLLRAIEEQAEQASRLNRQFSGFVRSLQKEGTAVDTR